MEKLLTIKEAKLLLGVTTHTIQECDKKGLIRAVRTPGGRVGSRRARYYGYGEKKIRERC